MSTATLELPQMAIPESALLDVTATMFESLKSKAAQWEILTESERQRLTTLAYGLLEHPKTIRGKVQVLAGQVMTTSAKLTGQKAALNRAQWASHLFIQEVLDQIERSNPAYQTAVTEALSGTLEEISQGNFTELTSEQEIRDYFRNTSRVALSEL